MCLYSRQILPRRATKDIIVYKEVICSIHHNMYRTPFLDYKITSEDFGHIKLAEGEKSIRRYKHMRHFNTEIGSGYFHCYISIPIIRRKLFLNWEFLKCTIPKGSLYWIGINCDICSDKLIFNKVLSKEEINQILNNNEEAFTNRMLSTTK